MPKVSICIPTYNNLIAFKRCFESVLIQTYKDYEVIITDDSTNDDIKNYLDNLPLTDNINYFKNHTSLGSPENWNEAIRKASGEYIKILHHDDFFTYKTSLQTFTDLLDSNTNADLAFVASKNFNISRNEIISYNRPAKEKIEGIQNNPKILLNGNFIGAPSATIFRNKYDLLFDKKLIWFVDLDLYAAILLINNNIGYTSEDAITIGIADTQISYRVQDDKKINLNEFFYILNKWKITKLEKSVFEDTLKNLLQRFSITKISQIRKTGYIYKLPSDLFQIILKNNLKNSYKQGRFNLKANFLIRYHTPLIKVSEMKITKLQGGLGNQMFQYAAARNKSIDQKVYLDFSFLQKNNFSTEHFTKRDFELGIFDIQYREFADRHRNICFGHSLKDKIYRKLFYGQTENITQIENEFIEIPDTQNIYLDGYFQSEKYFTDIRELLLKEFTFPALDAQNSEIASKINSSNNAVSIHIRRGDYLKPEVLKYHGAMDEEYYRNAVQLLEKEYSDLSYFIFSDDINYAKQLFQNLENVRFVDLNFGKDSWKDMYLMSICNHHIIANSSFSWWGAWLSQKEGTTIAPKNWFNKEVANFDIKNIVPSGWVTI